MAKYEVRVWQSGTKIETYYLISRRLAVEIRRSLLREYAGQPRTHVTIATYR